MKLTLRREHEAVIRNAIREVIERMRQGAPPHTMLDGAVRDTSLEWSEDTLALMGAAERVEIKIIIKSSRFPDEQERLGVALRRIREADENDERLRRIRT